MVGLVLHLERNDEDWYYHPDGDTPVLFRAQIFTLEVDNGKPLFDPPLPEDIDGYEFVNVHVMECM